ncbi:YonK family protein [Oceanobacillus oncorhynchi]|uniref:YonK family protein n=1 Tax=Oceanobacillus oncorhynchi TaxID=545501 RepID=UPI0034D66D75
MANPKSNINHKLSLNGELSVDGQKIVETVKQGEEYITHTYDFIELLRRFDGKEVSLSVTEKQPIAPASE